MNTLTNVEVYVKKNGPVFQYMLRVKLDEKGGEWIYEKRSNLYRSENGDVGHYYYYSGKPGDGFNGMKTTIKLVDGTTEDLIGPMSSNSKAINKAFSDREPLIECTTKYLNCCINIHKKALEKLGLKFTQKENGFFLDDETINQVVSNNKMTNGYFVKEF